MAEMLYGVVALDHQATSGHLSVWTVAHLTAFYGVLLLLWRLCAHRNPWNPSYLSGLWDKSLRPLFWGSLRSSACPVCPPVLGLLPFSLPSLIPSLIMRCSFIDTPTGASAAFSSLKTLLLWSYLTSLPPPTPDFASVSSTRFLKIFPLSECLETS